MIQIAREINLNMKGVNFLSQKYTLKIVTQVYKALLKIDEKSLDGINFPLFVYEFYVKKLGTNLHADKKFYQFLLSIRQYAREGCFRLILFNKFMTLEKFANYSI